MRQYYSDEQNRSQSPLDIHDVLSRLSGVRELGTGKGWIALCPAHEDRKPSLRIAEGSDGRVLLHCFAGCSPEEIVRAIFSPRASRSGSRAARRTPNGLSRQEA
jgi:hypothetical protein